MYIEDFRKGVEAVAPEVRTLPVQSPRGKELPRLISYNQFPLHYENIPAMTADLARIKAMGFTSVWSNPLFQPCESMATIEAEISRVYATMGEQEAPRFHAKAGSPYAVKTLDINPKLSAHAKADISSEERRMRDYGDIRAYTEECRRQGLSPLSDFVMRHVSVDSPLVEKNPHWFKRHANGNFVFFGRDENYRPTSQSWDDVLEFNFEDPAVLREVIDQHIKPMAQIVIEEFGFEGMRIDAAGKIPTNVYQQVIPYIDELCLNRHGKPATILGETLGQDISEFMHLGGYADYVYNSIYFFPFAKQFWTQDDTAFSGCKGRLQDSVAPTIGFAGNHDVARVASYYEQNQHIRGSFLRETIRGAGSNETVLNNVTRLFISLDTQGAFSDEQLAQIRATYRYHKGVAGTVDTAETGGNGKITRQDLRKWLTEFPPHTPQGADIYKRITEVIFATVQPNKEPGYGYSDAYAAQGNKGLLTEQKLMKILPPKFDMDTIDAKIRESFCMAAFASDGGWFFSQGDEWGVTKRTNVFTASPADLKERVGQDKDYSGFVAGVNKIVRSLPPPTNPEWTQRCYLPDGEKDSNIVAIYIHQGHGFNGTGHLVISNISNNEQQIDQRIFDEYRRANGRNTSWEKDKLPDSVYFCGHVSIAPDLSSYLQKSGVRVVMANSEAIPAQKTPVSTPGIHCV